MEVHNEKSLVKTTSSETALLNSNTKSHNPGLKALLAIKNLNATLEKDYTELLKIESSLDELNQQALLIIESISSPEATAEWKASLHEINIAINGINNKLIAAKEMIEQKAKEGYTEIWKQLAVYLTLLKDNAKKLVSIGLEALPEALHPQWENEFVKLETPLIESIIANVASCRVLLQMIERYTPDELNAITKIIVDKIPLNFTYDEAVEYQKDYYKALVNFKKEFKEEKNLWDKFLDILAGGTHQSPSERVMMERWLDGDKGDL